MRKTIALLAMLALFGGLLSVGALADDFEADPDELDIDVDAGPLAAQGGHHVGGGG